MKVGGAMEVTKEFYQPIVIRIDRITEIKALVKALVDAVDNSVDGSDEYKTLVSMKDSLERAGV